VTSVWPGQMPSTKRLFCRILLVWVTAKIPWVIWEKITVCSHRLRYGNLHSVAQALEHVAGWKTPPLLWPADLSRPLMPLIVFLLLALRHFVIVWEMHMRACSYVFRKAMAEKPFSPFACGIQSLMSHSEENGGVDWFEPTFQGNALFFGEKHTDPCGSN